MTTTLTLLGAAVAVLAFLSTGLASVRRDVRVRVRVEDRRPGHDPRHRR